MSLRAANVLRRAGITKVGHVLVMDEREFLFMRNFGEKSLQELASRLKSLGFFPMDEE
jgi:DNA-directed RNA polymerase subunit alpha